MTDRTRTASAVGMEAEGRNAPKDPTPLDIAARLEAFLPALRRVESSHSGGGPLDIGSVTTNWHRNPDGREAADLIEALISAYRGRGEALAFYANPEIYKPHPHGPAFDDRDLSFVAARALSPTVGGQGCE